MKIILQRSKTQYQQSDCGKNWIVSVTATAGDAGTDPAIFVFHASQQGDPISGDTFQTVATVAHMNELPVGAPAEVPETSLQVPYYRLPFVQLDFYSPEEAAEFWEKVQARTRSLLRNLKAEDYLSVDETVEIT